MFKNLTICLLTAAALAGLTIPAIARESAPAPKRICKPLQTSDVRKTIPVQIKAGNYTEIRRAVAYNAAGEIVRDWTGEKRIKSQGTQDYGLFVYCPLPKSGEAVVSWSVRLSGPGVDEHYAHTRARTLRSGYVGYNPKGRKIDAIGSFAALCSACKRVVKIVGPRGGVIAKKRIKATEDGWITYRFKIPFHRRTKVGKWGAIKTKQRVRVISPSPLGNKIAHSFLR